MHHHRGRVAFPRALACALLIAVVAWPAVATATPPTTSFTDPSSGLGLPGPAGADGWWVVAPFISLETDQDGTIRWRWDSGGETSAPALAGQHVDVLAPEGDHTLVAYSVNSAGETETPPGVWRRYVVDTQAPSQPTSFEATLVPGVSVDLSWGSSSDNMGGSGLLGYYVYRKTGLPPFAPSDRLPVLVPAAATGYSDAPPGTVDDYIYAVSALDAAGNESPLSEIDPTPTYILVYRFYNVRTGTHFYTANEAERDSVIANLGWTFAYEGVAYRTYGTPTGVVPLYRFYNPRAGAHFFTASDGEKWNVIQLLGWLYSYEGVAYYVSPSPSGTLAVHRFYNRRTGTHFYTASEAEKASVQANLGWLYTYEGTAFYVLP